MLAGNQSKKENDGRGNGRKKSAGNLQRMIWLFKQNFHGTRVKFWRGEISLKLIHLIPPSLRRVFDEALRSSGDSPSGALLRWHRTPCQPPDGLAPLLRDDEKVSRAVRWLHSYFDGAQQERRAAFAGRVAILHSSLFTLHSSLFTRRFFIASSSPSSPWRVASRTSSTYSTRRIPTNTL